MSGRSEESKGKSGFGEGVLVLREYIQELNSDNSQPLCWQEIFGNSNPVFVEYCSGNGAWINERAKATPEINWIAVERDFSRVRKIVNKRNRASIPNLYVIAGEAQMASDLLFPRHSIEEVYINFPDPWPKRRHAKNRLLNPTFFQTLSERLCKGGKLLIATDDLPYSTECIGHLLAEPQFEPLDPHPHRIPLPEDYGSSFFESLWRSKGLELHFHRFQRKHESAHP